MFTQFRKTKYTKYFYVSMFLFVPAFSLAQTMQSSNYQIVFDSLNTGGVVSSSNNYSLEDTSGGVGTGAPSSANYNFNAGYQQANIVASDATPEPEPEPQVQSASTVSGVPNIGFLDSLKITGIEVVPMFESAIVMWTTNKPASTRLSWGKTDEYEIGIIENNSKKLRHMEKIENLTQSTSYLFKIHLTDSIGKELNIVGQKFSTLSSIKTQEPVNVGKLNAVVVEDKIALDWNNPSSADFESVLVLRSNLFYPSGTSDGVLVYQGSDNKTLDVLPDEGETYYYTVFSKYKNGNYSSGAVAKIKIPISTQDTIIDITEDTFEDLPVSQDAYPNLENVTFSDFDFIQDGKVNSNDGNIIDIKSNENLKISIDYDKLPEVLKTIGITLKDPTDETKVFSFILRVNEDKTTYEAVIAPLENPGKYTIGISIIDFKNQVAKKIYGDLLVSPGAYGSTGLLWVADNAWRLIISMFVLIVFLAIMRINFQ